MMVSEQTGTASASHRNLTDDFSVFSDSLRRNDAAVGFVAVHPGCLRHAAEIERRVRFFID
jgi:hypothetical protein